MEIWHCNEIEVELLKGALMLFAVSALLQISDASDRMVR